MRVPLQGKLLPQQDQIGDESLLATLQVPGSGRIRQMIAAAARRYRIRLTVSAAFFFCSWSGRKGRDDVSGISDSGFGKLRCSAGDKVKILELFCDAEVCCFERYTWQP